MKETGIYCILNKSTGKCYIGSSSRDIYERWDLHRSQLNRNKHHRKYLQKSWDKHGSKNFDFFVLEIVEPQKCIEREQFYIDNIKPEYNINPNSSSRLGAKHSSEAKRKISKSHIGKIVSLETRNKRSITLMGHAVSNQTKEKISQKAQQRFAANPQSHPMYGKIQSQQSKEKIKQKRLLQDMSSHQKSINQIDKHSNLVIKTWDSIKSAANSLNISAGNISSACNNKLKSTGGFKWSFA